MQLYDQVQSTEIALYNRGKVELEFCAMGLRDTPSDKLGPGEISVIPLTGHIPALEHQTIIINYLPGVPMRFEEEFKIQVAHFEPDGITITGAAVFPRIGFNVPQPMEDVNKDIRSEARANLGLSEDDEKATDKLPHVNSELDGGGLVPMSEAEHNLWLTTTDFQTEVERLLVKQFSRENSERLFGVVKRSSKLR
jgi:hydrocephalus-inducing protein